MSIGAVLSLATSLDGKYLVSGSEDKSIKIFDIETKQEVHHFSEIHEGILIFCETFC